VAPRAYIVRTRGRPCVVILCLCLHFDLVGTMAQAVLFELVSNTRAPDDALIQIHWDVEELRLAGVERARIP
jgi:hypothetical protein